MILLREVLPLRSLGPAVLVKAEEMEAIPVSLNGGFSDIVTYSPAQHGGVIAIQLHSHPEIIPQVMARLTDYFNAHPDPAHRPAKLFLVEVHRIRIRQ